VTTTRKTLIALLLLASCRVTSARAATRLCVQVEANSGDEASLRKLVLDEMARHPTHRVVESGCQSVLMVEFFELRETFYLTVRINQEVPIRQEMKEPGELGSKVSDAISQVLSHDPVYLADDITHYSAIQRAAHSILKRGNNYWRLELFQGIGRGGDNAAFAPGGAVSINRGADHWQVYTRIYFGGWPGAAMGSERVLQVYTGADVGLTYEFNADSNLSFYVSTGLGLQYLRFEGRLDPANPDSLETRNDFGPSFHARVGLRFLRIYDFDCDLFVAGYVPLFPADSDTRLGDFYPPSLQAGIGVGF
jgi:hypothetical protein